MTGITNINELPSITFDAGIPGFPEARTFVLMHTELAQEPFSILKCLEDEDLEFVVVPPNLFFPEYSPEIDEATADRVGLESVDDALVLVMLTVGEDVQSITANLMGPVVINKTNNRAVQAILAAQDLPLRQPLFSESVLKGTQEELANS